MINNTMTMPNNIKIGPRVFKVSLVENLLDADGSQKLNGHILYDKALIRIDSGLAPVSQRLTMIHEIVHGIADYLDVEMSEKEVSTMANGITAMLMDNPDVLRMFDWEVN